MNSMKTLLARWFGVQPRERQKNRSYRPQLEALEDRVTPATFSVTNFTDTIGATGTLRAAIVNANNNPGPDTIVFKDSSFGHLGLHTIHLFSPLVLTDTVTINGAFGSSIIPSIGGQPGIVVQGAPFTSSDPDNSNAFEVNANGCILQGLIINDARGHAINLKSDGNTIRNCFIGTTADGSAVGGQQQIGILIRGSNNTIGGPAAANRNVISGNGSGVVINAISGRGTGNVIQGNLIGTDVNGAFAVRNNGAIIINAFSKNNLVVGNVISGNLEQGITIDGPNATGNVFRSNRIGVAADGVSPLGNQIGILVTGGAHDNLLGGPATDDGNIIGFNSRRGILVGDLTGGFVSLAGAGNQMQNNIIFASEALIDLGLVDGFTPNDALDADTGPNNFQNSPTLLSATRNATATSVAGTLASQPGRTYRIEVTNFDFVSNADQFILGSFTVTTDASGNATFNQFFGVSHAGSRVVAIATDLTTNDTSEFGVDVAVDTAPMIKNDALTGEINEGEKATLSGQLVDPDKGDKLSLVVNWGDGSPVQTYHPKLDPFAFKHLYEDDGTYDVTFTWLDDHGASNTRTQQVVVHNVAPQLQHVDLHPDDAKVHQQVVLTGKIVEPGADHLTLSIDWGDGTTDTIAASDLRKFQFKHRYQSAGMFTVLVTVDDGDGGLDSATLFLNVG